MGNGASVFHFLLFTVHFLLPPDPVFAATYITKKEGDEANNRKTEC